MLERYHSLYLYIPLLACFLFIQYQVESVKAQPPLPITPSGLNTRVSEPIVTVDGSSQITQYNITGGTRLGTNLFHSFGDFNVPKSSVANFINGVSFDLNGVPLATGLPTENILARVTNPTPSTIFGMIQTTGFDHSNLFLLNPSGIVIGPNASLNVGGSVTFTTANYLRLAETDSSNPGIFHANPIMTSLLSSAPLAAFGFLGSSPAAIAVHGSTLMINPGQSLSFVGGDQGFTYTNPDTGTMASVPNGITMTNGKLLAKGGQINLVSVASSGEVLYPGIGYSANDNGTKFTTFGTISLTEGTLINVSADSAGTVKIRGGQLIIDNATIAADTGNTNGTPVAIDIKVAGDMSIANNLAPVLTAKTTASGDAGDIHIQTAKLTAITSTSEDSLIPSALIDTHTSGFGTAGNVFIETRNLHAINGSFLIDSGSAGTGHGGNVNIIGTDIHIEGPTIATGDFRFGQQPNRENVTGFAGNLNIRAENSLTIGPASSLSTEALLAQAGDLSLQARNIHITGNSAVSVRGALGKATITVNTDHLTVDAASVMENQTRVKQGGDITINTQTLDQTGGGIIRSATRGDGSAGNILLTATERVTLDDRENPTAQPTGLLSNSSGELTARGSSGMIVVTTPQLALQGGAQINTSTKTSGNAGNIVINGRSISVSGERLFETPDSPFEIGSTRGSGIYTRTVSSDECRGTCGSGGNVTLTTESLNLESGGTINSSTINQGGGGNVTINASNTIQISGTMTDGTPSGIFSRTVGQTPNSGPGGNISLTAGQSISVTDGAIISASSSGPGTAGNIEIDAGLELDVQRGSITTQSTELSGGNIDIRAIDLLRVVDGKISTSAINGGGNGGAITIDPKVVLLQNSDILAQANRGNGGDISITTPVFVADQSSRVDASTPFGLNGRITIQSPTSNLSGTVGQLVSKTSPPQVLLQNRCVALAGGEQSTFVLAGRVALPSEPSGWLSSPVSMEHWTGEEAAHASLRMMRNRELNFSSFTTEQTSQLPVLSLRRLTPPGFLVRTFVTEVTGCPS